MVQVYQSAMALNLAIVPRWYQDGAADAVLDYFLRGNTGNPLVCLPTGTGKGLLHAIFMHKVLLRWSRQRFMCLTHVQELIEQNVADCLEYWPGAPVGIYSDGLGEKNANMPITFGGVASVVNAVALFGWIDVLIVDECHLMNGTDESMYGKIIAGLRKINPNLKVVGFTATPYRSGMGMLIEGDLFTNVVYDMTTFENYNLLMAQGYIAPHRSKPVDVHIDYSNVKLNREGEFRQEQVEAATDLENVTDAAVRETIAWGMKLQKKSWMVFAAGVDHAKKVAGRFRAYGVPCVAIYGDMDKDCGKNARKEAFDGFRSGKYVCVVVYGIGTTGFNHKPVDLIAHLRRTNSVGLWVQMNGRGGRPYQCSWYKKDYCLVLDFTDNTSRLGPINDPNIPQRRGKKLVAGVAPVKLCPKCGFYNHTRAVICDNCGEPFPVNIGFNQTAGIDAILRESAPTVETYDVRYVTYGKGTFRHAKPFFAAFYHAGPSGINVATDRIWIENDGASAQVARDWWRKRFVGDGTARKPSSFAGYFPSSVDEALTLTNQLKTPRSIRVRLDKSEPQVFGWEF